jgi:hypothetical protein
MGGWKEGGKERKKGRRKEGGEEGYEAWQGGRQLAFAVVDFPQALGPKIPRISPRRTEKDTSLTFGRRQEGRTGRSRKEGQKKEGRKESNKEENKE